MVGGKSRERLRKAMEFFARTLRIVLRAVVVSVSPAFVVVAARVTKHLFCYGGSKAFEDKRQSRVAMLATHSPRART